MTKKRLIVSLILKDGMVVQTHKFRHTNIIHRDPTIAVEHFNQWSIDELLVIDVSRTLENRSKFIQAVEQLSKFCFVPLTVGGWVSSVEDIRNLLLAGADKVCINSHAFRHPEFITEASSKFGSQCIVISIDAKKENDNHIVYIDRARENTRFKVEDWAKKVAELGAGEILLSSIDNDGDRRGYDLELMKKISNSVDIPIIAFGGAHKWEHFLDVINFADVDAAAAANVFHYVDDSALKAKIFLKKNCINIR